MLKNPYLLSKTKTALWTGSQEKMVILSKTKRDLVA